MPPPGARLRPALRAFIARLRDEAAITRAALGNVLGNVLAVLVATMDAPAPSP